MHPNARKFCKRGHRRVKANITAYRQCKQCIQIVYKRYMSSIKNLGKKKTLQDRYIKKYEWITNKVRYQNGGEWVISKGGPSAFCEERSMR